MCELAVVGRLALEALVVQLDLAAVDALSMPHALKILIPALVGPPGIELGLEGAIRVERRRDIRIWSPHLRWGRGPPP